MILYWQTLHCCNVVFGVNLSQWLLKSIFSHPPNELLEVTHLVVHYFITLYYTRQYFRIVIIRHYCNIFCDSGYFFSTFILSEVLHPFTAAATGVIDIEHEYNYGSIMWGAYTFFITAIVFHPRLTCVRAHFYYDLSFSFKENQLKRCSSEL